MPNTALEGTSAAARSLHVAAGVIVGSGGRILIAKRPEQLHQGGLWEFPGGKLEPGESVAAALRRELQEELGIRVERARPLIRIRHDYGDRVVLLDVWRVERFHGEGCGREGQEIAWVEPHSLLEYTFPVANLPIVTAARLPSRYLITPEPGTDWDGFLLGLERCLNSGVTLVQLRARRLSRREYDELARRVIALCREHGARLLLNADPSADTVMAADGVHLTAARLLALKHRPLPTGQWVAASCHNRHELIHAARIGVDFAVLSPVLPTRSHPTAETLGWERWEQLVESAPFPVYALGGMRDEDLPLAYSRGAQGIAAIRSIWGV